MSFYTKSKIVKEEDGLKRDVAQVDWCLKSGKHLGVVNIPYTGNGTLGPIFNLPFAGISNVGPFDTREWQWWKNYPFVSDEKRPRLFAPAVGYVDRISNGVKVELTYDCDSIVTKQSWLFCDQNEDDMFSYDCFINIYNKSKQTFHEYGQFFASYVDWNTKQGHFYLNGDGQIKNFLEQGCSHLNYYVSGAESIFSKYGKVMHCPRGDGEIKDHWLKPISISQPTEKGFYHLIFSQEARTSSITQGMNGVAQDYLLYPPGGTLELGQAFQTHIRHIFTVDWKSIFLKQWEKFEAQH